MEREAEWGWDQIEKDFSWQSRNFSLNQVMQWGCLGVRSPHLDYRHFHILFSFVYPQCRQPNNCNISHSSYRATERPVLDMVLSALYLFTLTNNCG